MGKKYILLNFYDTLKNWRDPSFPTNSYIKSDTKNAQNKLYISIFHHQIILFLADSFTFYRIYIPMAFKFIL